MITFNFDKKILSQPLVILLVIAISLGIGFRFFNIDKKVYWHDEAYTSLRAAGFNRTDIDRELFINQIIPAQQLQKYQQIQPGSSFKDTLESLAIEDPHHPPLYFLIARLWMQQFGGSLTASRSLPVLISLLSLPLMYVLAWQLFNSHLTALLATTFLALSPFDILFAQTARQYSLLTVLIIGSSILLLRSLCFPSRKNWGLYSLVCAVGLYTHLFFCLTILAQVVFVISKWLLSNAKLEQISVGEKIPSLKKFQLLVQKLPQDFFIAVVGIIILYIPWIIVVANNLQRVSDTTDWARARVGFDILVKLWILSFSCLFLDLDFGFDSIATYLLRFVFLMIIGFGVYTVCRYCSRSTKLFILTSIFVPFIILVIPDLLSGGQRSAVTRYLISCFPAIHLSVAYLLARYLGSNSVSRFGGQKFWRVVLAILLTASIASSTVSAVSDTWWNKTPSYLNGEVARKINASDSPMLLSDIGDAYTNTGDLISLSYILDDDVRLLLLSQPPNLEMLTDESEIFVFRPSGKLREAIAAKQWELESVVAGELWRAIKMSI